MTRRSLGAWIAVVVPLWVVMVLCTHWEPVARDGWGNVNWHRWNQLDWDGVWGLVKHGWLGSNPRLGQTVTTLLYTPGPYHVVVTPLLELALFWLATTLALGRWPSLRRADDALVFATVFAVIGLCTPQFGPMLFYRPFTGNYLFGLVLNLSWLVPYRLYLARPHASPHAALTAIAALLLLVLGFAAGMCNEHTGPAVLLLGALATVWSVRRGSGVRPWMIAGLVGLLAGYVMLLLAPGHDARYGGLAKQAGLLERLLDRGLADNMEIITRLALHLTWALPWVLLGLLARRGRAPHDRPTLSREELWSIGVLAIAGALATVTLLASPKVGHRLYFASVVLVAIAVARWSIAQLGPRRATLAGVALAGVAMLYVEVRLVVTYARVGPVGAERLAKIQRSPHGTHVVVPSYPTVGGKWFIGEDFVAENLRRATAKDYGLGSIELAPAE